jgi:hypothetical protein
MKIWGAGIAGLMAATQFQNAEIIEAGPEGCTNHKALLRFRSSAVGDALGIDFQKVRVHKGVFYNGRFVEPNIFFANSYSMKVLGKLADRSIWNLEPVDRYVAPENFIEQLIDRAGRRIIWNTKAFLDSSSGEKVISTIPMSVLAKMVGEGSAPEFQSAPIKVERYRIPHASVYQTVYFPDQITSIYRASITKDLLIVERMSDHWGVGKEGAQLNPEGDLMMLKDTFGLHGHEIEPIESTSQRFGKIAPIDDQWRKDFIYRVSNEFDIFSVGRYATWRNILLDDVLNDIYVVKKLMNAGVYERSKHNSK